MVCELSFKYSSPSSVPADPYESSIVSLFAPVATAEDVRANSGPVAQLDVAFAVGKGAIGKLSDPTSTSPRLVFPYTI